ncbi:MAG: SDR family oxidoreductase [Patescibacteria group bacterium]|jgi:NADP-dependent 3-hydroxy acid dehydrogenase YdfG
MNNIFEESLKTLEGKTAVITGGTSGIGLSTALNLASLGCKTLVFSRDKDKVSAALKRVGNPKNIIGASADVTKYDEVKDVFDQAERELGRIDILINNAAIPAGNVVDSEYPDWQNAINTMLIGYMSCAREAALRMRTQGKGHIVNVGSLSAEVFDHNSDIYVAAKSGVRGFTFSLRKKLTKDNIKVSLVEPGLVATNLHTLTQEEKEKLETSGNILQPNDIARSIIFILTQSWYSDITMLQIRPHGQSTL